MGTFSGGYMLDPATGRPAAARTVAATSWPDEVPLTPDEGPLATGPHGGYPPFHVEGVDVVTLRAGDVEQVLVSIERRLEYGATANEVEIIARTRADEAEQAAKDYAATLAYGTNLEATDATVAAFLANPTTQAGQALAASMPAVPLSYFGAVGDGIAADTNAIRDAMQSGLPIDFGGPGKVYRLHGVASFIAPGPVRWVGNGAKIVFDRTPGNEQQSAIFINAAGHDVNIEGLHLDAATRAFIGLRVTNDSDTSIDLTLTDVHVENVRRSSTASVGGDGILIEGNFDRISITRPIVRNVTLAAGAGIHGAQGVAGITVKSTSAGRAPRQVSVVDPYIDGVYSEDPDYIYDQDGIRVFAAEDTGSLTAFESHFNIVGGKFRNCMGRAVKSQMEWGVVDGVQIIRDMPFTPHGATDIDFQVGGGIVSNVEFHYDGTASNSPVGFSRPVTDGKQIPHGSVSNLRVVLTGGASINQAILFNQRGSTYTGTSHITVRGVEVIGPTSCVLRMNGIGGGTHHVAISDVFAAPTDALVRAGSGSSVWTGQVMATNCLNLGASPVLLVDSLDPAVARPIVNASNCMGWSSPKALTNGDSGAVTRVDAIAPLDTNTSATLRPVSARVANGGTAVFPETFTLGATGLAIVSIGHTRLDQGIFITDATNVLPISVLTGHRFSTTTGGNTEPTEGMYRLWIGPDLRLRVSNYSGSTRTISALLYG